jgi:hypothetical protein
VVAGHGASAVVISGRGDPSGTTCAGSIERWRAGGESSGQERRRAGGRARAGGGPLGDSRRRWKRRTAGLAPERSYQGGNRARVGRRERRSLRAQEERPWEREEDGEMRERKRWG